jgi:hypothetical protein
VLPTLAAPTSKCFQCLQKDIFAHFFRVCTEEIGSEVTNCLFLRTSYMGISLGCVFYLLTRVFWVPDSHHPAYLSVGIYLVPGVAGWSRTNAPCGYEHMQCSINIVIVSGFWEPMSCGKSAV